MFCGMKYAVLQNKKQKNIEARTGQYEIFEMATDDRKIFIEKLSLLHSIRYLETAGTPGNFPGEDCLIFFQLFYANDMKTWWFSVLTASLKHCFAPCYIGQYAT